MYYAYIVYENADKQKITDWGITQRWNDCKQTVTGRVALYRKFDKYENAIEFLYKNKVKYVQLCKNCKHLGSNRIGYMSWIYYCKVANGSIYTGNTLGIHPWYKTPHPKCPLNKTKKEN